MNFTTYVQPLYNNVCSEQVARFPLSMNWSTWPQRCTRANSGGGQSCYYGRVIYDSNMNMLPWQEIEAVVHEQWDYSPLNCMALLHCRSRATFVHVPSYVAHCRPPQEQWNENVLLDDELLTYWNDTRRLVSHSQLMLLYKDWSWDSPYSQSILRTLAMQPPSFVRRVLFLSQENAMEYDAGRAFRRAPSQSVAPLFISMPETVLTVRPVDASKETRPRPFAALFQGRVNPGGSRDLVYRKMLAMGAVCAKLDRRAAVDETAVTCTLCTVKGAKCDRTRATLEADHKREPLGSMNTLALASHSTFCFEPHSDTPVRTHLFAAVQAGCIPVIFDHFQWAWRDLPELLPTLPSYRQEAAEAAAARMRAFIGSHAGWRKAELVTNYSRFVVRARLASHLQNFTLPEPFLSAAEGEMAQVIALSRWRSSSGSIDDEPVEDDTATSVPQQRHPELQRLQRGLGMAAALMRYAEPRHEQQLRSDASSGTRREQAPGGHAPGHPNRPGPGPSAGSMETGTCLEEPCDAFGMLTLVLETIRVAGGLV